MRRWRAGMNEAMVLLGSWMFLSPWVLGFAYSDSAVATGIAWLLGTALVVLGAGDHWYSKTTQQATTLTLGILLLISPWAGGFKDEAIPSLNALLTGLLTVGVAGQAMLGSPGPGDRFREELHHLRDMLGGSGRPRIQH